MSKLASTTVRIPAPLRPLTGGLGEVQVLGATVGQALDALAVQFPELTERILDSGGSVRGFVNLYLGDRNINSLGGFEEALSGGATLSIVPAVAGGVS